MKKILFTLISILFITSSVCASEDMVKGSKLYLKGKYKEAIDIFSKEQTQNQKDVKINYNLACAYYRDGQFDKAIEHYKIALDNTEDNNFKSAILYNIGNCQYRKQDKDEALEYYKGALKLNSSDIQAKHNIEFLQQEQQQNKDNNNDQQKNKDNKQDKNNQQQQNKDNKQDNKNKDKQQNQKDKEKDKNKEDNKQQDKNKEKEKNKQNQQLLDYFDKQDKQNNDKSKEGFAIQGSSSGKNW